VAYPGFQLPAGQRHCSYCEKDAERYEPAG
jgi:hypothetical protein